jgi:hypothetical protein
VEKHVIIWACVCSLRYPVCNAHAPYYFVIWGLPRFTIFFHIISQTGQLKKKILNVKCVLIFSRTSVWNKSWARYDQKCTFFFMWSTGYSCHVLMKLEFSRQIFENNVHCQIRPVRTDRRTDRHDEANGRFSQNCEKRLKMFAGSPSCYFTVCKNIILAGVDLLSKVCHHT